MEEDSRKGRLSFFSLDKMRKNPWILISIFLAVVFVVYLMFSDSDVVSKSVAEKNLVSFIEAQGGSVEIISSEQTGSFYTVTINYQGKELPWSDQETVRKLLSHGSKD